ncbi:MAG: cyclic nucleotide-binding domain-containing protein, partial [Mariprofundales bacterium]|nr:cyclic nucleotide-binding domain-containing protein [Mariprofundales bacterium]
LVAYQYRENDHFRRAVDLVMERRSVNSALALNPLFSALPVDVRQSMYHVGEMVSFTPSQTLLHEHDSDIERCYLLLTGRADGSIAVPGRAKESIAVDHYSMGDQVGEIALLNHPVQIKTVVASSAITALCISNKTLHTFRMGNLDFAMALHENTRRQMIHHMNLLIPKIGEAEARAATIDRMIPLELYRNPERQMTQPFT